MYVCILLSMYVCVYDYNVPKGVLTTHVFGVAYTSVCMHDIYPFATWKISVPVTALHHNTIASQTTRARTFGEPFISVTIKLIQQTQNIASALLLLKPTMCRNLTLKVIALTHELERHRPLLTTQAVRCKVHHACAACVHGSLLEPEALMKQQPLLNGCTAPRRGNV